MSLESVMPSNHLLLCHPLLLLPSVFPSIRVFSNELAFCISRPKYWNSASASVLPMNIQGWFPLGCTGWISSLFTVWFHSTGFSLFLWLSIVVDPSAHNTSWAKLRFKPVMSSCRCEIEATLERLKKLERDLSFKEQELKERERRLKMWEQKLTEQSNTPVSAPRRARWHLAPPPLRRWLSMAAWRHLPCRRLTCCLMPVMEGPAFILERCFLSLFH